MMTLLLGAVLFAVLAAVLACALVRARREVRALKREALLVRLRQVTSDSREG
jgi:hypothetical protein